MTPPYDFSSASSRILFIDAIKDALNEADGDDRFLSIFPDMSIRTTTDSDGDTEAENYLIYLLMGDDGTPNFDEVMGIVDKYFFYTVVK